MTNILASAESVPFREKVAWLSLLAMAVPYGPYFTWMVLHPPTAPLPDLPTMFLFGVTSISHALILGLGRAWLRWRCPDDARLPADERDQAITLRALAVAYQVLILGTMLTGIVMPFQTGGWRLINAAIAAIVLAELVSNGVVVWSYRRSRS